MENILKDTNFGDVVILQESQQFPILAEREALVAHTTDTGKKLIIYLDDNMRPIGESIRDCEQPVIVVRHVTDDELEKYRLWRKADIDYYWRFQASIKFLPWKEIGINSPDGTSGCYVTKVNKDVIHKWKKERNEIWERILKGETDFTGTRPTSHDLIFDNYFDEDAFNKDKERYREKYENTNN